MDKYCAKKTNIEKILLGKYFSKNWQILRKYWANIDKNWANNGQIFHKYWTNIVRILGTYYANIEQIFDYCR